jgi:hypothetical protein
MEQHTKYIKKRKKKKRKKLTIELKIYFLCDSYPHFSEKQHFSFLGHFAQIMVFSGKTEWGNDLKIYRQVLGPNIKYFKFVKKPQSRVPVI